MQSTTILKPTWSLVKSVYKTIEELLNSNSLNNYEITTFLQTEYEISEATAKTVLAEYYDDTDTANIDC